MLPKIPYIMQKNKSQIVEFRGINYSDMISDGDMSDSFGVSMRRFPYLTTKKGREIKYELEDKSKKIEAFTVYGGKLLCRDNNNILYYDGKEIGVCSGGDTKFATVGNKVVIYPDKTYVDFSGETPVLKDLESEVSGNVTFTSSSLTFTDRAATPYTVANAKVSSDGSGDYRLQVSRRLVLRKYEGDNYLCVLSVDGETRLYRAEMYDIDTWFDDNGVLCAYVDGFPFKKGNYAIVYDILQGDCRSLEIEKLEDGGRDAYGNKFYKITFGKHEWKHTQDGYILLGKSSSDFGESRNVALEVTPYGQINQQIIYGTTSYSSSGICKFNAASGNIGVGLYHGKITNAGMRVTFNSYLEAGSNVSITLGGTPYSCTVKAAKDYTLDFASETSVSTQTFNWASIKADAKEGLANYFSVGDCVEVSGSKHNATSFIIDKIVCQTLYASAEIFNTTTVDESGVTVARLVPDLDFICENHNRLFGCSNKDRTIYVSSLGDPTNMYAYDGVATDSYAVAVPGEGDFTACVRHDTSVIFFKEDKIYKLAGSYPAEFALYSYEVPGVQAGSENSCALINEVLYYKGVRGIYRYDGSIPVLISDRFGDRRFFNAVAGSDGASYYVSMQDGEGAYYLFVYDTQKGIWMLEEKGVRGIRAARISYEMCVLLDDGVIYRENAVEDASGSEWMVRFAPIFEIVGGKRSYSRILARISLPKNSYLIVKIRCDGGVWREVGKIVGKTEAVVPIRIPINRCDKFELELSGKGNCTILDVMREYYVSEE